jgi:hypothetical protein
VHAAIDSANANSFAFEISFPGGGQSARIQPAEKDALTRLPITSSVRRGY